MRVIGALSQSSKAATIYFCECTISELEEDSFQLPKTSLYIAKTTANGNGIMLALESCDELATERKCVGMIFTDTEGYCVKALSSQYEDIAESMAQIYEWEYRNEGEEQNE